MPKRTDLTGKQFGNLTVLEMAESKKRHTYWKCACSCGKDKEIRTNSLISGRTRSCGCVRLDDLTGRSFGKLNIVALSSIVNNKQLYSCVCQCGKMIIAEAGNIRDGHTTSCGSCSRRVDITGERFGKLVALERFIGRRNKSLWKCLCDCGRITYGEISLLKNGHKLSCGCLLSKAEMEFKDFLENDKYSFCTQFSFPDCVYKNRLKFDFAIFKASELLCLVELQGEQHFYPVTFKKGKSLSKDEFKVLQIRDNIKTEYCQKNRIPLLCINYQDFKNKESIFIEFLKQSILTTARDSVKVFSNR